MSIVLLPKYQDQLQVFITTFLSLVLRALMSKFNSAITVNHLLVLPLLSWMSAQQPSRASVLASAVRGVRSRQAAAEVVVVSCAFNIVKVGRVM
jgi:hypothetical protein